MEVEVKTRYSAKSAKAKIRKSGENIKVEFEEAVRGITPRTICSILCGRYCAWWGKNYIVEKAKMNMRDKGISIIIIIIVALLALVLVSIIIGKVKNYKMIFFATGDKTKVLSQNEYRVEDVGRIEIGTDSGNVRIVEGTEDKIKVIIYGIDGEEYSEKIQEDGTLRVEKENDTFFMIAFLCWTRQEIYVEVPKNYSGEIRNSSFKWKYRNYRLKKCKYQYFKQFWKY